MTVQLHVLRPTSFAEHVGANIRAEAARAGVTQRALAAAIGMNQGSASARWRGLTPWTLNDIEAVARVLGTTTSVLCARPEGLEPPTSWFGAEAWGPAA